MCCRGLESSLDEFLRRLSEAIGARDLSDMAQLKSHLSLSPPLILVLDGVESILDPLAPGAAGIASAIEEFSRCQNLCLFLTSRADVRIASLRRIKVPGISAENAQFVFHTRCHLGISVEVDNLEELDRHPLSIDLLASATCENYWGKALLKAWNDGKTNILKAYGRQSLEDNIKLTHGTPTIRVRRATALKILGTVAGRPSGVEERELESAPAEIAEIGDVIEALCECSLVYRQDGFVKMPAPLRFYFQGTTETLAFRPGSGTARDPAVEDIQYTRPDVADSGSFFFVPSARGNNFRRVSNRHRHHTTGEYIYETRTAPRRESGDLGFLGKLRSATKL